MEKLLNSKRKSTNIAKAYGSVKEYNKNYNKQEKERLKNICDFEVGEEVFLTTN